MATISKDEKQYIKVLIHQLIQVADGKMPLSDFFNYQSKEKFAREDEFDVNYLYKNNSHNYISNIPIVATLEEKDKISEFFKLNHENSFFKQKVDVNFLILRKCFLNSGIFLKEFPSFAKSIKELGKEDLLYSSCNSQDYYKFIKTLDLSKRNSQGDYLPFLALNNMLLSNKKSPDFFLSGLHRFNKNQTCKRTTIEFIFNQAKDMISDNLTDVELKSISSKLMIIGNLTKKDLKENKLPIVTSNEDILSVAKSTVSSNPKIIKSTFFKSFMLQKAYKFLNKNLIFKDKDWEILSKLAIPSDQEDLYFETIKNNLDKIDINSKEGLRIINILIPHHDITGIEKDNQLIRKTPSKFLDFINRYLKENNFDIFQLRDTPAGNKTSFAIDMFFLDNKGGTIEAFKSKNLILDNLLELPESNIEPFNKMIKKYFSEDLKKIQGVINAANYMLQIECPLLEHYSKNEHLSEDSINFIIDTINKQPKEKRYILKEDDILIPVQKYIEILKIKQAYFKTHSAIKNIAPQNDDNITFKM